jgi:hypothetical protein
VKEKFVSAWTDSVMHIDNTTTNRVESQHGALKQYLTDCKGDLVKGWEAINQMVPNQLTKIKTSFGQSTTAVEHYFKNHFLYIKLVYNISRQALHFIRGEEIRSRDCGRNRKKCGCVIKKTYGLPCACLIALKIEKKLPIRLDEVNTHWKRLQIDDVVDGEVDCLQEFNVIQVTDIIIHFIFYTRTLPFMFNYLNKKKLFVLGTVEIIRSQYEATNQGSIASDSLSRNYIIDSTDQAGRYKRGQKAGKVS